MSSHLLSSETSSLVELYKSQRLINMAREISRGRSFLGGWDNHCGNVIDLGECKHFLNLIFLKQCEVNMCPGEEVSLDNFEVSGLVCVHILFVKVFQQQNAK